MYTVKTEVFVEAANQAEEDAAIAAYPTSALWVMRTDLLPPTPVPPVYEDLTTFTEVDPASYFSTTSSTAAYTALTRSVNAYLYKDYGVDYFTGNYSIDFECKITGASTSGAECVVIGLNNILNNYESIRLASGNMQGMFCGKSGTPLFICLTELSGGSVYNSTFFTPTLNTNYFMRMSRDSSVGTYGTMTLRIYSDSARTLLVATLILALHSVVNYRYLDLVQSVNSGSGVSISGAIANVSA